jgi:antitoxin FitA
MSMSKMIQIRNVSDELHRTLKARAAQAGMSLSDFLRARVEAIARRPTLEDLRQRIAAAGAVNPSEATVDALRAEREAR